MKKILVLTIAIFSLFACSSDDENNLDPIIGTWYFFSYDGIEVDDCNKKSTMFFYENGTFLSTVYENQNSTNNCQIKNTTKGTWSYKGKGYYEITASSETSENILKIVFSDNKNTFTAIEWFTAFKRK